MTRTPALLLLVALLVAVGCVRKTEITRDRVISELTDSATRKVRAANLGWASLTDVRIIKQEMSGNAASVDADVKADQTALGTRYELSARLRLHYQWKGKSWELTEIEEIRKWRQRSTEPREAVPGVREPGSGSRVPSLGDSAIDQLQRAKRLARRNIYSLPLITP